MCFPQIHSKLQKETNYAIWEIFNDESHVDAAFNGSLTTYSRIFEELNWEPHCVVDRVVALSY